MNIDFTARRLKLDPRVKELVEKKLAKLARVLPPDAQAHVIVHSERNAVAVEVTVVGRQRTWTATERADDQVSAVHLVLDKIAAQAKRTKAKTKEEKKHREPVARAAGTLAVAPASGDGRPARSRAALRREPVDARLMFEEDALTAFAASPREVLVYRDPTDESFRVLYRRRDGSLGLVVPT